MSKKIIAKWDERKKNKAEGISNDNFTPKSSDYKLKTFKLNTHDSVKKQPASEIKTKMIKHSSTPPIKPKKYTTQSNFGIKSTYSRSNSRRPS